jgi:hypothetical protein
MLDIVRVPVHCLSIHLSYWTIRSPACEDGPVLPVDVSAAQGAALQTGSAFRRAGRYCAPVVKVRVQGASGWPSGAVMPSSSWTFTG